MHLKQNTDYALRILMYVAQKEDELAQAKEICEFHNISYSHVVKTVNKLGKLGYLSLKRGRYGGGIRMGMDPAEINLATVVEQFESNLDVVECFNPETNTCRIMGNCKLFGALKNAKKAFMESLADITLADLISPHGNK